MTPSRMPALRKNILTVGAATDVVGGYAGPGSVGMTSFSCWGPTDDGRIKPDVVGNGFDLLSAFSSSNTAYGIYSGTSMSSPNVSGSLGLLLQHYRDTHGGSDPQAATLKGVVIHTADEAGAAAGPDYAFGWGLVNTLTAANQMTLDQANPGLIQELWLSGGQVVEQTWASTGAGPLKATICWTDVPGSSPAPALDPADKALVNDLNLVVIGPDSVSRTSRGFSTATIPRLRRRQASMTETTLRWSMSNRRRRARIRSGYPTLERWLAGHNRSR